ncbi:MarR family winged helix-turn-helix transcriptional regulator [Cellulomonas shaoxiangyii]|uniref:MarR family transcriptional regulator n=1 Tax=Cellulomonas shaoxiangyii TaxID=2566013 RepID=A0A4P7SJ95_9CELL|nr:MarR family winged helix-turn-helix transcriptional regulator [Cellulomonas shaoxiangyii]QCB92774.1 MarR family transcriptional regulator [Cellulomonas shaoxiangyii]TGY84092.1 MarR family transcriptional regulator [Cellulomonas shaoxiangyii]
MSDDPVLRLERELGLFMRRARAAAAGVSRDVHPDLDPSAYSLMSAVAADPGTRASDLADRLGVGRGTMSRQLARLERLGLVAREADPRDSRSHPLTLTAEGARRLAAARTARREWFRAALGSWGPQELEDLAEQLARLNTALGERARATGSDTPGA